MDQNRIKRLLSTEYKDFSEEIIVESPFAETTRVGRGVREVTLALTRSKLIVASDVLARNQEFTCLREIDPCIECFELISVYPLEFVNLSVFRRRRRKTLKARLVNGRVTYYEIGGIYNRKKYWRTWCTQVEILASQKETGSSLSETTAGSSSSSTTLYFLSSDLETRDFPEKPRTCRLWAHYLGGGDGLPTWPRKDVYLGPSYNELGNGLYAPVPVRFAGASFDDLRIQYELRPVSLNPVVLKSHHSWPTKNPSFTQNKTKNAAKNQSGLCDVLFMHRQMENRQTSTSDTSYSYFNDYHLDNMNQACGDHENSSRKSRNFRKIDENESSHLLAPKISRFGFGIRENCSSGLYLQPHEGDPDHLVKIRPAYKLMDPYKLIESGVLIWENSEKFRKSKKSDKTSATRHTTDFSTNYSEIYSKNHFDCNFKNSNENYSEYFSNRLKYSENHKTTSPSNRYENFLKNSSNSCSRDFTENSVKNGSKHLRRYALSTSPHFFFGLGPWSVNPGDKFSIQGHTRRSSSLVTLRRQPMDEEMRLPVSKKQLATSVSMTSLEPETCASSTSTRGRIVIFWTPDYWYRPREATVVYKELRTHLKKLQNFHQTKEKHSKKQNFTTKSTKNYNQNSQQNFTKNSQNSPKNAQNSTKNPKSIFDEKIDEKSMKKSFFSRKNHSESQTAPRMCSKSSCILNKIFSIDFRKKKKNINKSEEERTIDQLRRLLKLNFRVSIWDIDSSTLAQQLTLIDRDLFLRIPGSEVEIVIFQKSSRNAPNIGAWIAFSHRISSLVSSEILAIQKIDMRARMLARFVNAVNKCFCMGNFNSAKSMLAGLQSPPVYRLKATWKYLKVHHSTRYETFTKICRVFKNCRTEVFLKSWENVEAGGPGIPFIGHVLARILGIDRKSEKEVEDTPRKWTQKDFDCGCTYLYQALEEEKRENDKNSKKNTRNNRNYEQNQRNDENFRNCEQNIRNCEQNIQNLQCYKQNGKNVQKIEKNGKNDGKRVNLRSTPHTITKNTKNMKILKNNRIHERYSKNETNLLTKMISSTFGKVFSINSQKTCSCDGKCSIDVFWAAKRLIFARRAVDRWQTRVLTARIIREHEERRRNVDKRRKRAQEVCRWMEVCQRMAREFEFPAHSIAWEFLLKARYKEDKENFFVSLKLEPPLG